MSLPEEKTCLERQQEFCGPMVLQQHMRDSSNYERLLRGTASNPHQPSPKALACNKLEAAKLVQQWLEKQDPQTTMVVYSDASHSKPCQSWAAVVHYQGKEYQDGGHLHDVPNSFDAETIAGIKGLELALSIRQDSSHNICILIDNMGVVKHFNGHMHRSGPKPLVTYFRAAAEQAGGVVVGWVPGHSGIPGNEAADELAKHWRGRYCPKVHQPVPGILPGVQPWPMSWPWSPAPPSWQPDLYNNNFFYQPVTPPPIYYVPDYSTVALY